jgi:DNA-binding transcriptional ArsR family regulator
MLQLSQRPLTASDADRALFVDRQVELQAIRRSLALGLNVLVLGEGGSGRSSLLRRLARELDEEGGGPQPIVVDANAWSDAVDVALAIRAALGEDVRGEPRYEYVSKSFMPGLYERIENKRRPALDDADVRAMAAAGGQAFTILVDGVAANAAHALFGRFRDTLWEYPHRWVVTGDIDRRSVYLRPPADVFFETVVEMTELDVEAARQLLRQRIDLAGGDPNAARLAPVVDKLVESLQVRTPRNVLSTARLTLLSGEGAPSAIDIVSEQQARAAALGRPAAMLYAELESLGPVHAGDERLLGRLGYTRSRVVQLLKRLEEQGLVEARMEGRRKIYALPAAGGIR